MIAGICLRQSDHGVVSNKLEYNEERAMDKTEFPDDTLKAEPTIHSTAFVARGAQLVGDVRLGAGSSVWYNAVLRGDINYVAVGENSNIQDGTIMHVENDRPCIVEDNVTVGHGAILHACKVESGCLVGMGAILLSGSVVGRGSCIAAGTVVRENTVVEPFSLWAGVPGRFVRRLDEKSLEKNLRWAKKYVEIARVHRSKGLEARIDGVDRG
jgi:carbonic anhydrase/acetyltransferase-like protein (isoleucine patch superfamily)